jgi:valyl-tRNA synthetase
VAATAETSAGFHSLHHGIVLPHKRESPAVSKLIFTKFAQDPDFTSPDEEKDFDLVLSAVRAARSLAASYNLQSNIQREYTSTTTVVGADVPPVFIHSQTGRETTLFRSEAQAMVTLIKGCNAVTVIDEVKSLPPGCGSFVINSTTTVHLLVKVCM